MYIYIALIDIRNFYNNQKAVFAWLIISMSITAFILNFAFSFNEYRRIELERQLGTETREYTLTPAEPLSADEVSIILEDIMKLDLPSCDNIRLYSYANNDFAVIGSIKISNKIDYVDGFWIEGRDYLLSQGDSLVCVLDERLLKYGERTKMTGETFDLFGNPFTIKGVLIGFSPKMEAYIPLQGFIDAELSTNKIRFLFGKKLSDEQEMTFQYALKGRVNSASLSIPPQHEAKSTEMATLNMLQYTAIIILAIANLTSLIKYWRESNKSTYSIYIITGAQKRDLTVIAIIEALIIGVATYSLGTILNLFANGTTIVANTQYPVTSTNVLVGVVIYIVTLLACVVSSTLRTFKEFDVKNVRAEW